MTELQWKIAEVLFYEGYPMHAAAIAKELGVPGRNLGAALAGLHRRGLVEQDSRGGWDWIADEPPNPKEKPKIVIKEDPTTLRHRISEYFKSNPGLWFTHQEIAEVLSYANAGGHLN